ncbi:MAG TPA: hypothetical protein VGN82_14310 [Bosea sp. (in: a-proteobacteria)]|jgi:hypothetical protein|uniref:terminase small subunit-like protein n=1 Tax=Bosea sp. (in: a-proteobacteria) TaxID=1871050 RepID=UPI002E1498C4|nr:hypothetical protein [Bosea sp. (in: a-proteobacteria)]
MGAEQAPKRGRPSDYADDLVDEFCRRIAQGGSVASVCEADDMPDHATVYRWQRSRPDFCERLAHARAERSEAFSNQILVLGKRAVEEQIDPARVRVAIDAIDKAARIMQPRKVELTGANGGPIKTQDLSRLSDEQLAALDAILGTVADAGGGEGGDPAPGDSEGA